MRRLKTILLLIVLTIAAGTTAHAQSVGAMIDRFEEYEGAECMKIPSSLLWLVRVAMPNDTTGLAESIRLEATKQEKMSPEEYEAFGMAMITLLMHTKSLEMLDLTECTATDRTRFAEATANWIPKGFAKSDEGVFIKRNKKGELVETVGVFYEDDECGIVHIKGDLTIERLKAMEATLEPLIN